jgi:hypothetical protein
VPIVIKSGSLNLLEPSGPVKACNGIALPFYITSTAKEKYRTAALCVSISPRIFRAGETEMAVKRAPDPFRIGQVPSIAELKTGAFEPSIRLPPSKYH